MAKGRPDGTIMHPQSEQKFNPARPSVAEATKFSLSTESEDVLNVSEEDILFAQSNQDLIHIIKRLTSSSQDEIFSKYKDKMAEMIRQHEKQMQEMRDELKNKQDVIDYLVKQKGGQISDKEASVRKTYVSPLRQKHDTGAEQLMNLELLSREMDNIGTTLDMLELLTGLRIINFKEDDYSFHFDVKQSSTTGNSDELSIEYQLVIAKEVKATAEINYIPTFLEAMTDERSISKGESDLKFLVDSLPDYFCDNLTFPYNSLSLFYAKMNRSLNKLVRGYWSSSL